MYWQPAPQTAFETVASVAFVVVVLIAVGVVSLVASLIWKLMKDGRN